jgi:hypothetical protein
METTMTNVGHYHPSTANWSYQVWLIVDDTGAKLYKSTFGGQHRMKTKKKIKELFVNYSAQYKGREINKMEDIENYNGRNYPAQ